MNKLKNMIVGLFSGCFTALTIQFFLAILPALLIALILLVLTAIHPDLIAVGILMLGTALVEMHESILLACGLLIGLGLASGGLIGFFSSFRFFNKHPYLAGLFLGLLMHLLAGVSAGLYFTFGSQQDVLAWPGFWYLTCPGPLIGLLTVFILRRGKGFSAQERSET
jgi:hypothetical protein